jgi:hypothetical protein
MSDFNFNNFNVYENNEQEIRPPDNPIREILVNNYYNNNYNDYDNINTIPIEYDEYDDELQLAYIESIKEHEEYEKKRLEMLEKTRLRFQTFKDVLLKIKKISMIDPQILKFYNIIEPMIDSYCAGNIDIYECDKSMYDEIFSTLKTIRLTELELELFKKLFIMEK